MGCGLSQTYMLLSDSSVCRARRRLSESDFFISLLYSVRSCSLLHQAKSQQGTLLNGGLSEYILILFARAEYLLEALPEYCSLRPKQHVWAMRQKLRLILSNFEACKLSYSKGNHVVSWDETIRYAAIFPHTIFLQHF